MANPSPRATLAIDRAVTRLSSTTLQPSADEVGDLAPLPDDVAAAFGAGAWIVEEAGEIFGLIDKTPPMTFARWVDGALQRTPLRVNASSTPARDPWTGAALVTDPFRTAHALYAVERDAVVRRFGATRQDFAPQAMRALDAQTFVVFGRDGRAALYDRTDAAILRPLVEFDTGLAQLECAHIVARQQVILATNLEDSLAVLRVQRYANTIDVTRLALLHDLTAVMPFFMLDDDYTQVRIPTRPAVFHTAQPFDVVGTDAAADAVPTRPAPALLAADA